LETFQLLKLPLVLHTRENTCANKVTARFSPTCLTLRPKLQAKFMR